MMPNFVKIGQIIVEISRFMWFFKMTPAILVFEKLEILTICTPQDANLRHHAKFHQNRSNGCGDMAI